jgi:hypothetical protein
MKIGTPKRRVTVEPIRSPIPERERGDPGLDRPPAAPPQEPRTPQPAKTHA